MEKPNAAKIEKSIKKAVAAVVVIAIFIALWNAYGDELLGDDGLTATGTIEATTVKISSSLPGVIGEIYFNEGDNVSENDIVAEIIREDLAALLAQNEAALDKAELGLSQVTSNALIQQTGAAQSARDSAYQSYIKAEADYIRYKTLYEQGAAAQSDMERFQTAYEISKENYANASAQLQALKSSGGASAQIGSAQTDIDKARAAVDSVRSQIGDLTLKSPINGVLTSKNYEKGEFVTAGSGVVTIADLDDLWIRVYVTTEELPDVILGEKVRISVSGHEQEFEGIVTYISDQGEYTPKTVLTKNERANVVFAVKISTDSGGGVLKPGMPADVTF